MAEAPPDSAERIVAIAMFVQSGDGTDDAEAFDALPDADRADMLELARTAMKAHVDWLTAAGFRIAPPGTMLRPKSDDDAKAMIMAGTEWLNQPEHARGRRKGLVASPKIILPPGTKLQ